MTLKKQKDLLIVSFLTIFAYLLISQFISAPFNRGHDAAGGTHWGAIARNYVRYGYLGTKFGMVQNGGSLLPAEFIYYTHHPPLTPIILSLSFRVFGLSEWSIRFTYVLFALGTLVLFYTFINEFFGRKIAVLACLSTLLTPMYLHFSSVPDMISITLFFCLGTIYSYARWLKTHSLAALSIMSVTFLLATLSSWEAYYLIPAILYHNFARDRKREIVILMSVLGILSFLLYSVHVIYLVGTSEFLSNIKWAIYRTGIYAVEQNPEFLFTYVKQILIWAWFLFTPFVILLSFGFAIMYFNSSRENRRLKNYDLVLLFLIFGILKYFFFINLCYYHPQRFYYLIPFFTLSASLIINFVFEKIDKKMVKLCVVLLLSILITLTVLFTTKPVFFQLHHNDSKMPFSRPKDLIYNERLEFAQFYSELIESVHGKLGSQDMILTNQWYPRLRFYLDVNTNETISNIERLENALKNLSAQNKKMLFVFLEFVNKSDDERELFEYLKKNFRIVESFPKQKISVFDLNQ